MGKVKRVYVVTVTETVEVMYYIEAKNENEARERAEAVVDQGDDTHLEDEERSGVEYNDPEDWGIEIIEETEE
jgi:hypothetical protein